MSPEGLTAAVAHHPSRQSHGARSQGRSSYLISPRSSSSSAPPIKLRLPAHLRYSPYPRHPSLDPTPATASHSAPAVRPTRAASASSVPSTPSLRDRLLGKSQRHGNGGASCSSTPVHASPNKPESLPMSAHYSPAHEESPIRSFDSDDEPLWRSRRRAIASETSAGPRPVSFSSNSMATPQVINTTSSTLKLEAARRESSTLPPAPVLGSSINARHVRSRGSTIHVASATTAHQVGHDRRPRRLTVTVNPYEVPSLSSAGGGTVASQRVLSPVGVSPRTPKHGRAYGGMALSPGRVLYTGPLPPATMGRALHTAMATIKLVDESGNVSPTYFPSRPLPSPMYQPTSTTALLPDSRGPPVRRARAYTDTGEGLKLRENMLSLVPPSDRPGAGMISMAVSRLLARGGGVVPVPSSSETFQTYGTGQLPSHLAQKGARPTADHTLGHRISVASSMSQSESGTLVEEHQHHHVQGAKLSLHSVDVSTSSSGGGMDDKMGGGATSATTMASFNMATGRGMLRKRSIPALPARAPLPTGPLPELPMTPMTAKSEHHPQHQPYYHHHHHQHPHVGSDHPPHAHMPAPRRRNSSSMDIDAAAAAVNDVQMEMAPEEDEGPKRIAALMLPSASSSLRHPPPPPTTTAGAATAAHEGRPTTMPGSNQGIYTPTKRQSAGDRTHTSPPARDSPPSTSPPTSSAFSTHPPQPQQESSQARRLPSVSSLGLLTQTQMQTQGGAEG